jgi:hypothetical protein
MLPHVGKNYATGGSASILLVGESHYLPDYSTQHLTSSGWYAGDQSTLNKEERYWINPSEIIAVSSAQGFRERAHSIYKHAFGEINKAGPKYADYRRVGDEVIFYNYFLRPALRGMSLKGHIEPEDLAVAREVFLRIFDRYKPSAIAFLSKFAHACSGIDSAIGIPVVATPHPGCAHWNMVSPAYGNRRGRDILADLVANMVWDKE